MEQLHTRFTPFPNRLIRHSSFLSLILCIAGANAFGARNRITARIDNTNRVTLRGHLNPRAQAAEDEGPADAAMVLPHVTLVLKQSPAQEAELTQLLADQQDPASPRYHQWLTPEQYGDRFGASQDDINKISSWLQSQNLSAVSVARARNAISFTGSTAAVQRAFNAEIHNYLANGETHFANATEPTVPAAFQGIVGAIHGLNNFRLKPPRRNARILSTAAIQPDPTHPNYNSSKGSHYLAPDDVATIYNLRSLYNSGINGTGQKIAIAGQTRIDLADVQQFRSFFNLPAKDPQTILVPGSRDPGIRNGDEDEANLDIEWSGAVARNADIIYVYAPDVMTAAQYVIDQNVAPVLSISYGSCEAQSASSEAFAMQSWARQGNAQGITWFAASGDSGGTDCAYGSTKSSTLSVDVPAALPEVTGVGGTTFNEGSGSYWNATADNNRASALSYIPEVAWNDSVLVGEPASSGGGASNFFSKPSWQNGPGVPDDKSRDVPDVSLAASADHDGYITFSGGSQQVIGGTSVGSPSFAGIAALLNHYLVSNGIQSAPGLGNMNPRLYALAQSTSGVFHDIIEGDNIIKVTCGTRSRNCVSGSYGFSTGAGYDQATGLGSVDAYNLVTSWSGGGGSIARGSTSLAVTSSAASISPSGSVVVTVRVTSLNGGMPSGTVSFSVGGVSIGTAALTSSNGVAVASMTISGNQLHPGSNTITAEYTGDTAFAGASGSTAVGVQSGPAVISGLANGASFTQRFAPGMILTIFGSQLAPSPQSAARVPLPSELAGVSVTMNGITAPLYYVSPTQLNVQVPYELPAGSNVALAINNNGIRTSTSFALSAAAPGIFTDQTGAPVPNATATRGSIVTLYITGDGAVTPSLATGSGPAAGTPVNSLPRPQQFVSVTVGGARASIQFIGIPVGLVGVTQINYQVPTNAPSGNQRVVVTVGNTSSAPSTLRVQ